MLDLKFIKENIEDVKKNIDNRFMKVDVDEFISLYDGRITAIQKIDGLRQSRNENASKMKGPMEQDARQALIDEGKKIKEEITSAEKESEETFSKLEEMAKRIPNMAHPEAPIGKEDKNNLEIARFGTKPSFNFKPKDHVELGEEKDLIDFEAGANVVGSKFYFLKNDAVFLEMGLVRYALDILKSKGFELMITPDLAKMDIVEGTGFNPRGPESNIYTLADGGLCLVGTAEITLGGYNAGKMLDLSNGPILYAGVSHCFRREAGAAGQYSKGLYRVHQFTKVEMFAYCTAEESDTLHLTLKGIEQEIFNGLEIPFRVVDTCTGDLGAPAYRKFDLEAWMPGRGENGDWGEVTSTSNCTDYQARRLSVRYKNKEGKSQYAHTLNGTAIAISRAIIAIMENFQQADGTISIPKKLVPYVGFEVMGK